MLDRQPSPGKEGRMLIVPENGGEPFYATLLMADEPLEEGTVLNKATLLKDATAAMYGKGASAVPNDIFAYLGKYAQHWWKRTPKHYAGGDDAYTYVQSNDRDAHPDNDYVDDVLYQYLGRPFDNAVTVPDFEIISYTGTGTYGADNPNSITFSRAPQLIIMIGGRYTRGNKTWHQLGANEEDWIYMLPTEALSTEFEEWIGLGNNANGGVYGKKSEDGKTISWYNEDQKWWQYNDSDMVYYLLALFDGGGNGRSNPGRS